MERIMSIVNIDYDLNIDHDKLMEQDWADVLKDSLLDTPYMENLMLFLHEKYKGGNMYPKKEDIFKCFKDTSFATIKTVILCREPYTNFRSMGIPLGNNDAYGHVFSQELIAFIKGIEKSEYDGFKMHQDPTFKDIINQGVFFMDVALTSSLAKEPMQHKLYWKNFTREVIKTICSWHQNTVFILLGDEAQAFKPYITGNNHIVCAEHPAESIANKRKFDASFTKEANDILEQLGGESNKIIW